MPPNTTQYETFRVSSLLHFTLIGNIDNPLSLPTHKGIVIKYSFSLDLYLSFSCTTNQRVLTNISILL